VERDGVRVFWEGYDVLIRDFVASLDRRTP
jgi:hypothetical protein